MLTTEQEKWIDHLRNDDQIVIKPYDPTCTVKYEKVRQRIQAALGQETVVHHCGATGLGISGQDEIDVYVPISPEHFNELIPRLTKTFGPPKSYYPLERARFVTNEDGKHIDIFLINKLCPGWTNGLKFETYLRTHSEALKAYLQLKESGNGLSTREYYRRKIEFINDILARES